MRAIAKKVLLSVAVSVLLLIGLELLCRALGLGDLQPVTENLANWDAQWDGEFYVIERSTLTPAMAATINSDGLRDAEHLVENPAGRPRYVFLGDSVTFGHHLPREQSLPWLVGLKLAGRELPPEVFNVALPGWATLQQRIAYERIASRYRPDQVLVGFCLNDVSEMQNNLTRPPLWLALTYQDSYLCRFIMRPHEREIHATRELFEEPAPPAVRAGWTRTLAELLLLRDHVRADGAELSIVVFPFRFQLEPNAPPPRPQQRLQEFCARHGIGFLDVLPALREIGPDAFVDYDHFTLAGVEAVAEAIVASGLLGGG